MVKKERKRKQTVDEKDIFFRVHGRHVPSAKIRRYEQSRGIGDDAILSPPAGNGPCSVVFTRLTSRTDTPAHVTYSTSYGTPRSGQPHSPREIGAQEDQSLENDEELINAEGSLGQAEESARGLDQDLPLEDLSNPSLLALVQMPIATEQYRTFNRYDHNSSMLSALEKTACFKDDDPRRQPEPLQNNGRVPSSEDESFVAQAYAHDTDVSLVDNLHVDHLMIGQEAPERSSRGDSNLGDRATHASSMSSYPGHEVIYIGYDGVYKQEFDETLQQAESLYSIFRGLVLRLENGTWSGQDHESEQQIRGSGSIQSPKEVPSIYNELLEGYEFLQQIALSPWQPGELDPSTIYSAMDSMTERWHHDTQRGNAYGLVRGKHIRSVLDLASIYSRNGSWESLPALLTKLIFDLWLAKKADNGELVAATQILRVLVSLWSDESPSKDTNQHK